jgi:hypothetical protein
MIGGDYGNGSVEMATSETDFAFRDFSCDLVDRLEAARRDLL